MFIRSVAHLLFEERLALFRKHENVGFGDGVHARQCEYIYTAST